MARTCSADALANTVNVLCVSGTCDATLVRVTTSIEVTSDGKVATMDVTRHMYRETGATNMDTEGFANYPRSIEGVAVGVLLRETEEGHFRVSLRAAEGYDVDVVARHFGGGGHTAAAGCRIDGGLETVKARVREAIVAHLGNRNDPSGH